MKCTLTTWLRVFVGFLTVKLLSPPLSIQYSLKGSHDTQPTVKKWRLCAIFLEVDNLHKLIKILLHGRLSVLLPFYVYMNVCEYSFIRSTNHSFISTWTHGYLFYIWDYKPRLFYCSNFSCSSHWEFFQLADLTPQKAKIIKNQEGLRNYHNLRKSKERWWLNIMWYPG